MSPRHFWRNLVHRDRVERDLGDELHGTFALLVEEKVRAGATAQEARRLARLELGGVESLADRVRDVRTGAGLDSVLQDIRHAARTLRRAPGFTIAAVATLALGIGINAAVFTVTNAVLFKGFRLVDRNDRLLYIYNEKNGNYAGVSYPDFKDWRAQATSFEGMGAAADWRIVLDDPGGYSERYTATRITANAFQLLGQKPILGRDFVASDERSGAAPVAILTYGFWERRFGKDPAVIGQTLQIHGEPPTTVIGVMPRGFSFPQNQDLWIPLAPTVERQPRDERNLWFAFGRLAEGAMLERARAELDVIGQHLASAYPRTNREMVPAPKKFVEFWIVGQIDRNAPVMYRVMLGAVAFVLLIACANLANLMLARTMGRGREIALRRALGAGRWRIIRQLLTESLMLSATGGALGWWIARWAVPLYQSVTEPKRQEWSRNVLDYTMDGRVVVYLMAISIGAGLLFGLAPALRFSKLDSNLLLKDGGSGATGGRHGKRLSGALIVGEVALAVVLLAGAGVMIRSFLGMAAATRSLRADNTLVMALNLPKAKYSSRAAEIGFLEGLVTRLTAVPGVESASIGPLPRPPIGRSAAYELAGAVAADARSRPMTPVALVGSDYFRSLGLAVRSGREFNTSDGPSSAPVVVVSERFASRHWPGQDPVGQWLRLFDGPTAGAWRTVVGIVPDMVQGLSHYASDPVVYVPYRQGYQQATAPAGYGQLFVRTSVPPLTLVPAFRREIGALDPSMPIWNGPDTLADVLQEGLYGNVRNHTALFLMFAAIALLLACAGLYAVVAYSISRRTQEIGVRTALGATARDILTMVLGQGMRPAAIGLAIGLLASLAVTPLLKAELVGVSPADPLALIIAAATLMAAATLGCLLPGRRAMRVDPMVALRHD